MLLEVRIYDVNQTSYTRDASADFIWRILAIAPLPCPGQHVANLLHTERHTEGGKWWTRRIARLLFPFLAAIELLKSVERLYNPQNTVWLYCYWYNVRMANHYWRLQFSFGESARSLYPANRKNSELVIFIFKSKAVKFHEWINTNMKEGICTLCLSFVK